MLTTKPCQIALFLGAMIPAVWAATAQAGDTATITVSATIVSRTCTPDWKTDPGKTTIALGTVDAAGAAARGDIVATGETTLGLSNCHDVQQVTVTAKGTPDTGDTSAFANSLTGTGNATGVAVLLKGGEDESTVLKPDGSTNAVYAVTNGSAALTFKAVLEGNGETVADGAFNAPITLNMAYE